MLSFRQSLPALASTYTIEICITRGNISHLSPKKVSVCIQTMISFDRLSKHTPYQQINDTVYIHATSFTSGISFKSVEKKNSSSKDLIMTTDHLLQNFVYISFVHFFGERLKFDVMLFYSFTLKNGTSRNAILTDVHSNLAIV